jgi:hypothetical protein
VNQSTTKRSDAKADCRLTVYISTGAVDRNRGVEQFNTEEMEGEHRNFSVSRRQSRQELDAAASG